MESILTVSSAATEKDLTTLSAVKVALGLSENDNDDDEMIDAEIPRVSALIASYLNVARSASGEATLGRETLVETFRSSCWAELLLLSRYPVASITSIVADGDTLTADEYEVEAQTGRLFRLDSDERVGWYERKIVVTYVAGWLLPDESGRNLPKDIEDIAIDVIAAIRSQRGRGDVMARSESVVGVGSIDYATPSGEDAGLPSWARAKLDRYRMRTFG